MKKTGFTLAEVLITLSIIGVVAMMTLPALMTNVQEQQAKTGLKKGLNTLAEAAQMNKAVEGFDYGDLISNTLSENDRSMTAIMRLRTQFDPIKSSLDESGSGSSATITQTNPATAVGGDNNHPVVFFRDGSAVLYHRNAGVATECHTQLDDGLPRGFVVIYDINGEKAPNLISNCASNTALQAVNISGLDGAAASGTGGSGSGFEVGMPATAQALVDSATNTPDSVCTKANRVIKDQMFIRLRGSFAQPEGAASWYLYNH